jgi:hypothetical protein
MDLKGRKCWRRLHEELLNLYASQNIIWVIISRRMRWEGCTAWMGNEEIHIIL